MGAETGISNHTIQVKDIRLHYTTAGNGPPLLLLHGWPHTSYGWRLIQQRLADQFTCIAPDLRGVGFSTKAESGYDADNLADDLHELARTLDLGTVGLIGHDWGGVWGYHYAAQFRDEVSGLAIFEMMLPGTGGHEEGMIPKPDGQFFWHMGWHSVPEIPEALIRGHERMYLQYYYENFAYNPAAIDREALDEYVRAMELIGALRAGLRIYQEFWTHAEQATRHAKDKLSIPTIGYGGEALMGDLTKESLQKVADDVEGGAIPRCGHWVAEEAPDFVSDTVRRFFTDKAVWPR